MTPQDLVIQKRVLWAEIKAIEAEYMRLCDQIERIELDKKDILLRIKKKLDQVQEIGEELASGEQEYFKNNDQ